ncbi:MAG: 50S ribosomal protein L25 [Anaerolineae bacterium]|nr:50S ribosomal protein L25 [Anaerolineae bacterium]
MSDQIALEASKRQITGKKVKQLRREGIIPAIVYGPETEPLKLQIDRRMLRRVLQEAGGTQLIEIQVGKEKIPTLAREVQRDPLRGDILHVDFYRVSMTRKIRAEVQVTCVNEPPVVSSGEAIIIHALTTLIIEALPAELPPHIEVDLSGLIEIGDQLLVGDLVLPQGCEAVIDESELVVKIDYAAAFEEEEEEGLEDMLLMEESAEVEVITERKHDEEEEG